MKRLYSLDFLKLIFAYVIAFFHFGHTVAPGPTVTVQIFFFISGFFLAKKYRTRSGGDGGARYSAWDYSLDHAKGLYPQYVFAYGAFLLYNMARAAVVFFRSPSLQPIRETLLSLYDQIPNLLFMQSAYYFHDNMNYPLWQLSALVIGGYFVYALLCHSEKLSLQLLFPAAILMTMSLRESGVALDANFGPFYMPLLRSFAGLSYGVLVHHFTTTPYWDMLKKKTVFFNTAVMLSLVCIFVFAEHGNIHFVTGALLILGCWEESSWLNKLLNRPLFRRCGKLSYSIYVNHALICRFTNGFLFSRLPQLNTWQRDGIYFVLLTGFSILALWLVDAFLARRKRLNTAKD